VSARAWGKSAHTHTHRVKENAHSLSTPEKFYSARSAVIKVAGALSVPAAAAARQANPSILRAPRRVTPGAARPGPH